MNSYSWFKKAKSGLLPMGLLAAQLCTQGWEAQGAVFFGPPEAQGNNEGNSFLFPFDVSPDGFPQARIQQVYNASIFSGLAAAGGGWIYEIDFRVDASLGHSFLATIPSLQLNLSTTQRSVDGLSAIFDENVGANDTTIIGPQAVTLSGAGGGGVTGFTVTISFLSRPFFYNPAEGNLLLDFRVHQALNVFPRGPEIILDAFNVPGDSVSSVRAFGNGIPTMGQITTSGLATAIWATPVPEPSTWALIGFSLFALGIRRNRRNCKEATHGAN